VSAGSAHLHNEALGFPSATQNEICEKDAATLLMNGCKLVAEGANMPSALDATRMFLQAGILYGPAKAANAGGVATSGLEMAQNGIGLSWTSKRWMSGCTKSWSKSQENVSDGRDLWPAWQPRLWR